MEVDDYGGGMIDEVQRQTLGVENQIRLGKFIMDSDFSPFSCYTLTTLTSSSLKWY